MTVTSPRQSANIYPVPQRDLYGEWEDRLRRGESNEVMRGIVEWLRQISAVAFNNGQGKINNTGTVTLTASAASTTLADVRIGRKTIVVVAATTANAAADLGSGSFYQTYPNATEGQAVLNHPNNANADKTFAYCLIG